MGKHGFPHDLVDPPIRTYPLHSWFMTLLCQNLSILLLSVTSFLKLGALATAQEGTMTQSLHLCLQLGTKKNEDVWNGESLLNRL